VKIDELTDLKFVLGHRERPTAFAFERKRFRFASAAPVIGTAPQAGVFDPEAGGFSKVNTRRGVRARRGRMNRANRAEFRRVIRRICGLK